MLVPINYRLAPEEFAYILEHSGARVLCAHADYLEAVDGVRARLPGVEHVVALEGARAGWLDYESELAASGPAFDRVEIGERDLLTINYTSGTTARPKGVMITHRNAYINVVGHAPPPSRWASRTAISGRCRCFTPTAGRSCGPSRRPGPPTCACAGSRRRPSSTRSAASP